MFERIRPAAGEPVTIHVDGRPISARDGDTVAAALLAAGIAAFRVNPVQGASRGPYCLMGVCQDCRITIDGRPGVPACATPVRDGMLVDLAVRARNG